MKIVWSLIMSLSMKAVLATLSSGVTAGNTIDVTTIGFQPKAILCFWNGRSNGADAVGRSDSTLGMGAAASSSQRGAICSFFDDAVAAAAVGSRATNAGVILTCDVAGTENGRIDLDSFLSNGVRFMVDDQLPADLDVLIIAFGGDDITNAFVGDFLSNSTTGDQDFTGVGFDPGTDSAFFFFGITNMGNGALPRTDANIGSISFGAARSASPVQQYAMTVNSDDASATMDTDSHSRAGQCMVEVDQGGSTSLHFRASFVQSITNGFRLNLAEVGDAVGRRFQALIIKGGKWHLGDLLTLTDTTNDIVESGFGFQPKGAAFFSHCQAQSSGADATQTGSQFSVGGCTGTGDEAALGFQDENATADQETSTAIEHDAVYARISAGSAIDGLMRAQSFPDSDGFTMRMDDADPAQAFVWYVAAGDAPAAGGGPTYPQLERVARGVGRGVMMGAR